jgi:hypothetical protein
VSEVGFSTAGASGDPNDEWSVQLRLSISGSGDFC